MSCLHKRRKCIVWRGVDGEEVHGVDGEEVHGLDGEEREG